MAFAVTYRMKNLFVFLFGTILFGCSYPLSLVNEPKDSEPVATSFSADNMDPQLKNAALEILNQNCASCHTQSSGPANVYGLTDINHLFSSGLLVAGKPDSSPLFISVQSGVMPPTGSLSAADQNTLRDFIISAASANGSESTVVPVPQPEPTFTYIKAQILGPNCSGCHNQISAKDGYAFDTYNSTMKAVDKQSPSESKLYKVCQEGEMPPRPRVPLSSDKLNLILTWIESGALDN